MSDAWAYEAEVAQDHGGADVFHHVVCGDRHIAEVATEADARLIVEAVNRNTNRVSEVSKTQCPDCGQRGCSDGRSAFLQCPSGHIWTNRK